MFDECVSWWDLQVPVVAVEDMIKEVDVDGDGRIDFYGRRVLFPPRVVVLLLLPEFVNALGEPGTEDSYDDEDEEIAGY